MSGFKRSPFGKRLRTLQDVLDHHNPPTNRRRTDENAPEAPNYGDRFIPTRDGDRRTRYNLRAGPVENALFTSMLNAEITGVCSRPISPASSPRTSSSTPIGSRLLAYHSPSISAPSTPTRRLDTTTELAYSKSPVSQESCQLLESPRRQLRKVCKTPCRVLDAPELADDFYLNLVDWSRTDILGVGLGSCVYLWNAQNTTVNRICDVSDSNDSISSVSWVQKGSTLAVGTSSGRLHVYDATRLALLRTYEKAHTRRIGAIAWNAHVLTSGSGDHMVHHRDVRAAPSCPFKRGGGHQGEVCGLKWSNDGGVASANLASGGNDNKVCIWDLRGSTRSNNAGGGARSAIGTLGANRSGGTRSATVDMGGDGLLWKFHEHTAAVKALAWDPHAAGVLATGGGAQDKHLRFWNIKSGTMLNGLDTGSQVCNLIWSPTSHELLSTHGFSSTTAQNQICIWKYPTLEMVASLTGHTSRVLYLALSADEETIVTGAGDETLRFWKAFPKQEVDKRIEESRLDYGRLIR
ncbi:WD40 repeat-like protein [Mycena olivaceomarginata]|nr:WD40 repeat-like protein [Mycena olivaceomarginata]